MVAVVSNDIINDTSMEKESEKTIINENVNAKIGKIFRHFYFIIIKVTLIL